MSPLSVARLEAFRRLTLESALAEVAGRFGSLDLPFLVLKGPAFARWLYDDPRERPYGDLDLLVSRDRMQDAGRTLAGLGYELSPPHNTTDPERSYYHELWIRPGELPVEIELHYTLGFVRAAPELVWRRFSDGAGTIAVGGERVAVSSPPAAAFHVALHAAFHEHSAWPAPDGSVTPPIRDLGRALDRVALDTWRTAVAIAAELHATAAFGAGLRLDPRGAALAKRLADEGSTA